ncbi:MAG: helix-turn-helix transcriptional regulator [Clostridia bacterium]|nr:helix-turn-helix transcriptional regulator [Clostridia bacterium]
MLQYDKVIYEKEVIFVLSDNIRKYRKLNQLSQDELAERLGVTRQSISLWETGQTQPSLDNIVALAKVFGISTDNLLTDNEPASANAGVANLPAEAPQKKKSSVLIICVLIIAVLLLAVLLWQSGIFGSKSTGGHQSAATDPATTTVSTSTDELPENTTTQTTDHNEDKLPETKDLYGYLKNFVVQNGTINGDYCYYSKTADQYGGHDSEDFSLYYWGDTETIEFCLHSVIDETFSINFYLLVPKNHTGEYEYISSYYYRDTGEPLYEARGTITAGEFTDSYPLNCIKYIGSTDKQNEFMEISRQGVCDLITCLKEFITVENIEYSFLDFGFTKF